MSDTTGQARLATAGAAGTAAPARLLGPHQDRPDRLGGSSSSSSSVTMPATAAAAAQSRQDHVVHRSYLKTVAVLAEGRLTHYAGATKGGKRKEDKWFNLTLPEVDLHKSDLKVYQTVSAYGPTPRAQLSDPSVNPCPVPPLLVAFILDTSDLPNGQALLWNRDGQKYAIDAGCLGGTGKGKGKEREARAGIVLERWTLRATSSSSGEPSTSSMPPHTAYRLGVSHFRSLYALIRLLPAYRLYRKLRRANSGLRMGIKLWTAEGYPNSADGLAEAWEVMERGLLGLDIGLDRILAAPNDLEPEEPLRHELPALDIFGTRYTVSVDYRPEVDFHVEDMESVLSEKFVDMEEDWFTPTVARHRIEQEGAVASGQAPGPSAERADQTTTTTAGHVRRISNTGVLASSASPIPQRQQAATRESFKISPLTSGRAGSGGSGTGAAEQSSVGRAGSRYGGLGEGLPFAMPPASLQDPNKPPTSIPSNQSGASVTARRLSGHSIHPFSSSPTPSSSLPRHGSPLGPTSATSQPLSRPSISGGSGDARAERIPSSLGRTSSFLSQSGRSFTHAQMAHMMGTSGSPPVQGGLSGLPNQPHSQSPPTYGQGSPSSISYSRQSLSRQVSRQSYLGQQGYGQLGTSPFVPSSLERDANIFASSPSQPPQIIKRYSSSYNRQAYLAGGAGSSQGVAGSPGLAVGSHGSSGDGASLPGSYGRSLLRRTSTSAASASQHSTLRRSLERPSPGPDDDDIQAFLKTLDTLPQPPSVAAQAARSRLPSSSSSLSINSFPHSPSPLHGSGSSPGDGLPSSTAAPGPPPAPTRAPLTKAQLEAHLQQMAGSFNHSADQMANRSHGSTPGFPRSAYDSLSASSGASGGAPVPAAATTGMGLLSASRPMASTRRISSAGASSSATASAALPVPSGSSNAPYRRQMSGGIRSSSVKTGSPLAGEPLSPPKLDEGNPTSRDVGAAGNTPAASARSLPGAGSAPLAEDQAMPLRSAGMGTVTLAFGGLNIGGSPYTPQLGILSPQTTGGQSASTNDSTRTTTSTSRRGPVLLRGGFGDNPSQRGQMSAGGPVIPGVTPYSRSGAGGPSSASPSHSPIRDFATAARTANKERTGHGEKQAEEELGAWRRYRSFGAVVGPQPVSATAAGSNPGYPGGTAGTSGAAGLPGTDSRRTSGRTVPTAPSSLGGATREVSSEDEDNDEQGEEDDRQGRGRRGRFASEGDDI